MKKPDDGPPFFESDGAETAIPPYKRLPASPHSKQTFADGVVEVTAKFAHYNESRTPHRLYVFSPADISVNGTSIKLPSEHDGELARTQAYTIQCHSEDHYDVDLIIYYLHQMGGTALGDAYRDDAWTNDNIDWEALTSVAHWLTMLELHELTHWAVDPDENEQAVDHWERWNTTLQTVVEHITDDDISWAWAEYEVQEMENGVQLPVGMLLDEGLPFPVETQPEQAELTDFTPGPSPFS